MGWALHVARTGDRISAYRVLVERREGKRPFGRPRYSLDDNIKIYLEEVGWEGMDRIDLIQNTDR